MVGELKLLNVIDGDPLGMNCSRTERGLDSPDSGLPPSPSPNAWLQPASAERAGGVTPGSEDEGRAPLISLAPAGNLQLQPLSFGEGISIDLLPPKELRYTSFVNYDSKRHFIQNVALQLWGQGLEHYQQTIVALPHSTWRHYKTQLDFQPRHRPHRYKSTTIIYPKKTSTVYVTELSYDSHRLSRRFLSSVELEVVGGSRLPQ
ncbi:PREDICTED: filamin-interacting protein FAM101B [Cyprinodon variegatus]|uniref:Refilin B n=3 Tax=Cyprinodon variegatus TaxID=28743 RepID=A0A3Q2ECY6_CYPVA|nr:PREDICTED: filamin-interacting protein FAM101B [Cyprinodon variegatus]